MITLPIKFLTDEYIDKQEEMAKIGIDDYEEEEQTTIRDIHFFNIDYVSDARAKQHRGCAAVCSGGNEFISPLSVSEVIKRIKAAEREKFNIFEQ